MEFNEFFNYLIKIFEMNEYLPSVDENIAQKLYKLTEHMLEINKSMNLTAIKDEKSIILKHYADSLTVSKYIPNGAKIIDVGCGAGFPTLPIAIFRPDLHITALDSTAKRIEYVSSTANMLELENVTAISERAEILANNNEYREKFDFATARAVASLPILCELCIPFVRLGGTFVAMKAQRGENELEQSHNAISKCGGKLNKSHNYTLLDLDQNTEARFIIEIDKIKETPKEFPRHYSKINKKPL